MSNGVVRERYQGTPQGGPLSPLLANVLPDEVDKKLERRGHCLARYADDCNVYVRSRKAGERVMALLRQCYAKLRLKVNEAKSAVASITGRKFLGYSFWIAKGWVKREVAARLLATFKQRIGQLTRRSGGRGMAEVIERMPGGVAGAWPIILQNSVNHGVHGEHGVNSTCCASLPRHPTGEWVQFLKPLFFPVNPVFPVVQMRFSG